jgi:hypothetical protein
VAGGASKSRSSNRVPRRQRRSLSEPFASTSSCWIYQLAPGQRSPSCEGESAPNAFVSAVTTHARRAGVALSGQDRSWAWDFLFEQHPNAQLNTKIGLASSASDRSRHIGVLGPAQHHPTQGIGWLPSHNGHLMKPITRPLRARLRRSDCGPQAALPLGVCSEPSEPTTATTSSSPIGSPLPSASQSRTSKYPPAEPGALGCEPLKAPGQGPLTRPRFRGHLTVAGHLHRFSWSRR